jgi:hypothetical protein
MFTRVFQETKKRFVFQVRGFQLADDGLRFYIKPEDGMVLPAIMKWLKQVFAQRYNQTYGREGHIWGDRYSSRILAEAPPFPGEPPGKGGAGVDSSIGVRPYGEKSPPHPPLPPLYSLLLVPAPG